MNKSAHWLKLILAIVVAFVIASSVTAQTQPQQVQNLSFQADIFGDSTPENIEYVADLNFYNWGGFGTNAHVYRAFLQGGDQIAYAVSIDNPNAFTFNVSALNSGTPVTLTVTKDEYSTGIITMPSVNQLSYVWEVQELGFHLKLYKIVTLVFNSDITAQYVVSETYSIENLGPYFDLNSFSEYLHMDDISSLRDHNSDGINETLLAINNYSTSGYPVFGKVYLTHQNTTVDFVNDGRYATVNHYPAQKSFPSGMDQEVVRAAYVTGLAKDSTAEDQVEADARILLGNIPDEIFTIAGQVRDTNNNLIANATVSAGPSGSTLTDISGNYVITLTQGLAFGTYSLYASKSGYSFSGPITVTIPPSAAGQDFVGLAGNTDTTSPSGSIQSPSQSETFTPTGVDFSAIAQDNPGGTGVSKIDFYVKYNGKWHLVGQDNNPPYSIHWVPPNDIETQSITFSIYVYDAAGNVARDAGGQRIASFLKTTQEVWVSNRAYLNQLALGAHGWEMCSMSSIAMVMASAGLIGSDFASLQDAANTAYASGLRAPGSYQVANYLMKPSIGMSATVVSDNDKAVQWLTIKQEIDAGRPLILNSPPGGGKLTSYGHYIVVVGYAEATEPSQRQIIAYDPFGQWLGAINTYDKNKETADPPGGVKGRWTYYNFNALGIVHTIKAQRALGAATTLATTTLSMPDEVFILDNKETVTYLGHGQSLYPFQLYMPVLSRDYNASTAYQWLDATVGGAIVAQGDETFQFVSLPFAFNFYGNTYTGLYVSSNGLVSFGSGYTIYSNNCIPNASTPNNAIYAFWDDLTPTGGSNGNIYVKQLDASTFVIEWYQVRLYGTSYNETFEIVLRSDHSIKLQYQLVSNTGSATVGVENATGTLAKQYICNGIGTPLTNQLAIRYTTP